MRLRELQRFFQDRVLWQRRGIESQLNDAQDEDFGPRLDTYVAGYRTRLIEALGASYPVLKAALGDDEFEKEARGYIESTDSRHFSVRNYGAALGERLGVRLSTPRGQALKELAEWEWRLADVFDAADDVPLEVRELASVAPGLWPALSFSLRACVRCFDTRTNAVQWWRGANGLCDKPAELTASEPGRWLIWRRGVMTLFRSLGPLESELLEKLRGGATFGLLCESMALQVGDSDAPQRTASLLRGWLAEEIILDFASSSAAE
jgi:putative DNA-binding protein